MCVIRRFYSFSSSLETIYVNENYDRIKHKSDKHEIAVNLVMNFSPDVNMRVMRKSS